MKQDKNLPDAVRFYAAQSCESDDFSPVAVHAFNGLRYHLQTLVHVLGEVRDPQNLNPLAREEMLIGFGITLQRICDDMEVVWNYSVNHLTQDPWIINKVLGKEHGAQPVQ
jgi:hypothetical protein